MLHIKQKFHLLLPHYEPLHTQPVQFSPVTDDEDELTTAIADDPVQHDDNWELEEHPNEAQLEKFWNEVEDDIAHDPKWIKFSEDEAS